MYLFPLCDPYNLPYGERYLVCSSSLAQQFHILFLQPIQNKQQKKNSF